MLLLIGGHRAKRVPTEKHQFGYGRTRNVYGFVVSIILFLVGGLLLCTRVFTRSSIRSCYAMSWAVAVLLIALCLEGFSFRTAVKEANRSRGRKSILRFVRQSRQPELPVVVLLRTSLVPSSVSCLPSSVWGCPLPPVAECGRHRLDDDWSTCW